MTTHWEGNLEFTCEVDCKCEEKATFKYDGIMHIADATPNKEEQVVSLSTQETIETTYSVRSNFVMKRVAVCGNCKAEHEGDLNCTITYTHPITSKTKVMVVIMDGGNHQVVSVPMVQASASPH